MIEGIAVAALLDVAFLGHVVLRPAVATGALLAVRAVLCKVVGRLTDLASTRLTRLLALLGAISNTMTLFTAESTRDSGSIDGD